MAGLVLLCFLAKDNFCTCIHLSDINVYSWTVLRSQCIVDESSLKHAETGVSRNTDGCRLFDTDEWCSDADDWEVDGHDSDKCCVNDVSDSDQTVDGSTVCTDIVSSATDIGRNGTPLSAISPSQDATRVISNKPSNMSSSDEPAHLLQQLTINNDVSTQTNTSTNVQQNLLSTAKDELSNESVESTSNVAAELASYYIYVIEEPSTADHSDHVRDLLARYRLQEGSSFEAELESGKCMYVVPSFCMFFRKFIYSTVRTNNTLNRLIQQCSA